MPKYSVIIPVYNRPDEMKEMLDSLQAQSHQDFEVVVVEDGSTESSESLVSQYELSIRYFFKENTGPGDSRNFGMDKAQGDYFLFFDSDCVLPPDYFEKLDEGLEALNPDAFGGPDAAHESFSTVQKAINYSMTSFFTTGGIRGGKKQLDQYQPRSFNMGLSKEVYKKVGGFSDIHPGEDPDLSFRIMDAGYKVSLISDAKVFHKRRINFKLFAKQVYKFGVVRVILNKWHPGRSKLVYFFPSAFLLGTVGLFVLGLLLNPFFYFPLALYLALLFVGAIISTRSVVTSILAVPAALVQLMGYGLGYLYSWFRVKLFGQDERKVFSGFFFKNR